MNWQHFNILAATNYLRERIAGGAPDARAKEVYDGLLDVLDPSRIERRAKGIAVDEPVRLTAAATSSNVRPRPDATRLADAARPKKAARRKATKKASATRKTAKRTTPKPRSKKKK